MTAIKDWLESTAVHQFLLLNYSVLLPAIQATHVVAVGVVIGSILLVVLRIMDVAGKDLTMLQTVRRYSPWMWGGVIALLCTGILMILTEPGRELLDPTRSTPENEVLNYPFWIKMGMVVVGSTIAMAFQRHVRRNAERWDTSTIEPGTKVLACLTLLGWIGIIFMGRLIAYPAVLTG